MPNALAITWPPSNIHGWGVFGANLIRDLQRRGTPAPILFASCQTDHLDPEDEAAFSPLIQQQRQIEQQLVNQPGTVSPRGVCVMHGLGNNMAAQPINARFKGEPNVGFTFFEQVDFPDNIVQRSVWLDIVITGSTWNGEVLKGLGFPKVGRVFQGVNVERFKPRPRSGLYGDRFAVFSGGKLELRKSQDIVIAAFAKFHAKRPDSLLVSVWMNPWPDVIKNMAVSPLIGSLPKTGISWREAIPAWSMTEGLPEGAHIDLGPVANHAMPEVLATVDCALFPNRCEGGTNLVAMEAMASGLPCVLSANSGHLDLIRDDNCFALNDQESADFHPPGSDHWRESDVDEIVEALDRIYLDREEARLRGAAAHRFMRDWAWPNQIGKLIHEIDRLT